MHYTVIITKKYTTEFEYKKSQLKKKRNKSIINRSVKNYLKFI